MNILGQRSRWLVGAALVALASAGSAQAQPPAARSVDTIEEVVVTAELRATDLQETPVAVTAMSAEQLRDNFVTSISGVANFAPNVTVAGRTNALSAPFVIRGLGSSLSGPGLDDPVATYVDGVYLGRPAAGAFNFSDIERIEVLRGPQGTLRGRNSTAGAISVVSQRPSTDGVEGTLDGEFGRYGRARGRASINLPMGDRVAFRGGVYYGDDNGRSTNTFLNRKTDWERGQAVRGAILFKPTDDTDITLNGDWSKFRLAFAFDAVPYATVTDRETPGNPLKDSVFSNDTYSHSVVRSKGLSATVEHRFSDQLSLTSITAWRRYSSYGIVDADGSTASVIATLPASQGANNLDLTTIERQEQWTQEMRLAYEGEKLKLIGGAFFFVEDIATTQDLGIRGVVPASLVGVIPGLKFPDILRHYAGNFKNKSWAAFAQAEYSLTDQLTATVGARYTIEKRRADAAQVVPAGYLGGPTTRFRDADLHFNYNDVSPSFGLNYQASPDVFVYGRVSRAFKSGGTNETLGNNAFGPEHLWAYEAGAKTDLLDKTLRVNTAVFYYDYTDIQTGVPGPVPSTTFIENAGKATSYGAELETIYQPIEGLRLEGVVGYLHARYDDYVSTAGDLSGNRLRSSPTWTWTLSAQYQIPIGDWATLTPKVLAHHESTVFFANTNLPRFSHEPYTTWNAYLSLEDVDQTWFGRLYWENMTGERWRTTAQNRDSLTCLCRSGAGSVWYVQAGVRF